jgi:hypothetical protein
MKAIVAIQAVSVGVLHRLSQFHYPRLHRHSHLRCALVARPKNTDGDIDDLGVLVTAAYGLDTSWMDRGVCRGWGTARPGKPTPWQVAPGRRYDGISGAELVKYALLNCFNCNAQYDCAEYAVRAVMIAGTWSMPITQLRWLQGQRERAFDLIAIARERGVAMQEVAAMYGDEA